MSKYNNLEILPGCKVRRKLVDQDEPCWINSTYTVKDVHSSFDESKKEYISFVDDPFDKSQYFVKRLYWIENFEVVESEQI